MVVNLFDSEFTNQQSSVFGKTPEHVQYIREQTTWDGVTIFTDRRIFSGEVNRVQSPIKLAWILEPRCLRPHYYHDIVSVSDKFAMVLTYDAELLATLPNARFCPAGGVWINKQDWRMYPKTKLCSFLIGNKMETEGHRLRHEIADALDGLDSGIDFYGIRGQPTDYSIDTKLRVLKDYAFSIIANSCRENGLFDELIMDCMACGTVPVFYGAPDIGDYFNPAGILPFETVQQCVTIVNGLSFDLYQGMLPHAADNLARIEPYAITEDWIYENVLSRFMLHENAIQDGQLHRWMRP